MVEQLSLFPQEASTSSRAEHPAKTCRTPGSGVECRREAERAPASRSSSSASSANFAPDTSFGRTWLEFSPTSPSRSSSSRLQTAGMVLPTGRSTPSTSGARILTCRMEEWCGWSVPSRRDVGVCGLSDVLERTSGEHLKYFLSRKACAGIVRRAASRGKELPRLLVDALAYQMAWWNRRNTMGAKSQAPSLSQTQAGVRECPTRQTSTLS